MWWGIPAAKGGISHFWLLNTCTCTTLCIFEVILLPWDNVSEVLKGGQGAGANLCVQVNGESAFPFPLGKSCSEEEAHFSSPEPSKASPGQEKGVWSYRWSLPRTKQLVSYNQGQWRSHSQTWGFMEKSVEQVTWDLKELRSWFHLPEPQTPLRKVMDERLAG